MTHLPARISPQIVRQPNVRRASPHFSPYSFGGRSLARWKALPSLPTLRAGPEALLAPASALLSLIGPLFLLIPRTSVPSQSAPVTLGLVPEAIAHPWIGHASSGHHCRFSG